MIHRVAQEGFNLIVVPTGRKEKTRTSKRNCHLKGYAQLLETPLKGMEIRKEITIRI